MSEKKLDIMDTTLRDGEQTNGISFSGEEKLIIAQHLLSELGVNRVEVTSCYVSEEEQKTLTKIMFWAKENGFENNVEVLSFCDKKRSIDWLVPTGCKRINLLTKGSEHHCKVQLKKTLTEHLVDVKETVSYAKEKGISCNVYLEDWSNGIKNSPDYVWAMLDAYKDMGFDKILLPDTLGVLAPDDTYRLVKETVDRYPELKFEFHPHNDYGMAVANSLAAVKAGVSGVHVTINGLGERTGNANLAQVVATVHDHTDIKTDIDEKKLIGASKLVETFSGRRITANEPIVGTDVFTQTAGIHADGDKKGNLYESRLTPARFARDRKYALGKLSGKSNLELNLKKLNMSLTPEQQSQLLSKIVKLGDMKKNVTAEDLPFLVADILGQAKSHSFKVIGCVITSTITMKPTANVNVEYNGEIYEAVSSGNGGYDAFMNSLKIIAKQVGIRVPHLVDFEIRIPPGGKTNALVEAIITWEDGRITHAVSSDQVIAAIKATERMMNMIVDETSDDTEVA